MKLYIDASLVGFAAVVGSQWFYSKWPEQLSSVSEGDLSMAFRELYPIVAAVVIWGKCWVKRRILFMCDNLSAVFIIQKGCSKCLAIMKLMRTLTCTAAVNNLRFSSKHLRTRTNVAADSLSHLCAEISYGCSSCRSTHTYVPKARGLLWD